METKEYNYLPQDAKAIRTKVFVEEQGFKNEFDEIDKNATHLVMYDGKKPIAACRIYYSKEKNSYAIGRIAVIKEYRGKSLGGKILSFAEKIIIRKGGTKVYLSAQQEVSPFYIKNGYAAKGDVYYDEFCPHISMWKDL